MKQLYFKIFLFTSAIVLSLFSATAQKTEFGVMAGGAMYYGDIVNDFDLSTTNSSFGLFGRYRIDENVAIKGYLGYCRVGGADSNSKSEFQKNRNLAFWSDIYEGSVQIEFNFVKDIIKGRRLRNRFIPYTFIGVGAFYFNNYAFNPKTNQPVKLSTLHTEGKGYDPYSYCIPFGLGFRYKINSNVNLGIEIGARYTGTSYIDDVGGITSTYPEISKLPYELSRVMYDRSKIPKNPDTGVGYGKPGKQRGKVSINDIYATFNITLGIRLFYFKGGVLHGKDVKRYRYY